MVRISELSDMEAVFSLRQLTRAVDTGIDLADEAGVRRFVETAAAEALEDPEEVRAFMALFEAPETAARVARACLATVEERPALLEDHAAGLDPILDNPPRAQQMDMGLSLGLLTLAGVAMFLSGSLKIKTKSFELDYKGSEQVAEIFKAVLPRIPGWKG